MQSFSRYGGRVMRYSQEDLEYFGLQRPSHLSDFGFDGKHKWVVKFPLTFILRHFSISLLFSHKINANI